MQPSLKEFVEKIFSINPSFSNMFGGGIPGMSGTSITTTGAASTANDIVNNLRQVTSQFAEKTSANATHEEVKPLMESIEGDILNLEVLGQISEEMGNSLISELHMLGDN